jgi:hypothetical protein
MSENHLETCLYHLVGITEPVFKRLFATYDTRCITNDLSIFFAFIKFVRDGYRQVN